MGLELLKDEEAVGLRIFQAEGLLCIKGLVGADTLKPVFIWHPGAGKPWALNLVGGGWVGNFTV